MFHRESLTPSEQSVVSEGFHSDSAAQFAPQYNKQHIKWLIHEEGKELAAALTADILWDWIYVDELWVSPDLRGQGLGRKLMHLAEEFALSEDVEGIWLWTQSWQAEEFYARLGYVEFTRFDNFPKGHSRVGFRKQLARQ